MTKTIGGPGAALSPRERVAVAFDVETAGAAAELRARLGDTLGLAKLGSALFVREGMPLVDELKKGGAAVFLDLKFHDIPSVVGKAVEKAAAHGVDYLTVHASGGAAMIEAAVRAAESAGTGTKVLAVTVLTSLSLDAWRAGASPDEPGVDEAVRRLAWLAAGAGAHGLVGSPLETRILREAGGAGSFVVTPGIAVPGAAVTDQARTVTVQEAASSGADILVVGRGVRAAADPRAALVSIQDALREATS
jgi:orotidine-5'-phosphate decarboxylase